ncbi:MAG: hypothetical protein KAX49_18180 [Halanaerobiales bacterium]|nr:hypothetical protein [Halanaerobiales bacterium]
MYRVYFEIQTANNLLNKIGESWDWGRGTSSAYSCSETMNAKFVNSKLKFATFNIEY